MNTTAVKILAIESSTNLGGVSILLNDKVLFSEHSREQKSHSELIHQFIEAGLKLTQFNLSDFDVFAVSSGPGSFTGIRVAVNTGKTYSYIYKKPLMGITSLHCLAYQNIMKILSANLQISNIFCMINAYKNMVYCAQYSLDLLAAKESPKGRGECGVALTLKPFVIPVKDLATIIRTPTWVIGDGYLVYEKHLPAEIKSYVHRLEDGQDYPTAESLGQLAYDQYLKTKDFSTLEWNLFTPLYLRASEAEENKKGILYSPL